MIMVTTYFRFLKFLYPLLFGIGVIVLIAGIYLFFDTQSFIGKSSQAKGTVTSVNLVSNTSGRGANYFPVIRYQDNTGKIIEKQSDLGSNPALYKVGQAVTVLYDPSNPTKFKVDDFLSLWLPTIACILIGALMSLGCGSVLFSARRRAKLSFMQ